MQTNTRTAPKCPACSGHGYTVSESDEWCPEYGHRPGRVTQDVCSLCLGDGSERRITIDGDDECSLAEFADVNDLGDEALCEIAALGIGATYTIGGGAAPAVAITRVA